MATTADVPMGPYPRPYATAAARPSRFDRHNRPTCDVWLRTGKCPNTDSCTYSHSTMMRPNFTLNPESNQNMASRRYAKQQIQNKTCVMVVKQPFVPPHNLAGDIPLHHPPSIGSGLSINPQERQSQAIKVTQVDCLNNSNTSSVPVAACSTQRPPAQINKSPQNMQIQRRPCYAFMSEGICRKENCIYSHDPQVISRVPPRQMPDRDVQTQRKNLPSNVSSDKANDRRSSQVCFGWMAGKCLSQNCPYRHGPELPGTNKRDQNSKQEIPVERSDQVLNRQLATSISATDRNKDDSPNNERQSVTDKRRFEGVARYHESCRDYIREKCCNPRCPRFHDKALFDEMLRKRQLESRQAYPGPQSKTIQRDPAFNRASTTQVSPSTNSTVVSESSEGSTKVGYSSSQVSPVIPNQVMPRKKEYPCRNWKEGRCYWGDACPYIHDPEVQEAERLRIAQVAIEEAAKTVERVIFNCTRVTFARGASVQHLVTGFESCRVHVKNLSFDAVKYDVEAFFSDAGFDYTRFRVLSLRTSADEIHQEASVIFDNAEEGKNATLALDDFEFMDERLKLEFMSSQGRRGSGNDLVTLNLSFKAPSKRALAIYPTKAFAKEKAAALNNDYCGGRQVHVALNQPPPGRLNAIRDFIPNAVIINGLPVEVSVEEIKRFSQFFSVQLFPPKIFDKDDALNRLQMHMKTVGGLKKNHFEEVETPSYSGTIAVRAQFESWNQAKSVRDSLENREIDYIAGGRINIFLAYPFRFPIYIGIPEYESQKAVFKVLIDDHGQDDSAHISAVKHENHYVLRVMGSDKRAVGSLKVRLERLAAGEAIAVWDRFFLTDDGTEFLNKLRRKTNVYVTCDRRLSVLKAFGGPDGIEEAKKVIQKELDRLASMEFGINLKIHSIRFFVRKGVQILKDLVGEDNVHFDFVSIPCRITVRGGEETRHALRRLVDESLSHSIRTTKSQKQCPICFDDPVNPFPLACGHLYCNGCMKHLLTSAVNGKQGSICCIGEESHCKSPIPIPVIERFLPPTPFNQLLENSFRSYVDRNPQKFRYCATPDCQQIYRVTANPMFLQCPSCFAEVCTHCHSNSHEGLTCSEWANHRDPEEQEKLLRKWVQGTSNVKRCPDCKVFIERIDGCNHMKCLCGAHVCWICTKSFPEDVIYAHLTDVHGGPFDIQNQNR